MHKSQRVRTQSPTGQQSFSPEGSLWPDQGRLFQTWILNMGFNMGGFGSRMQGLARTCPIKRRCLEPAGGKEVLTLNLNLKREPALSLTEYDHL